jgi:hypothetical protein
MSEIILRHYGLSSYSEKTRLALALSDTVDAEPR